MKDTETPEPAPLPPVPPSPAKPGTVQPILPPPSEDEDDAEEPDTGARKAVEHWAADKKHVDHQHWKHAAAATLRGWHEGAEVSEAEYDKAVAEALAIPIR